MEDNHLYNLMHAFVAESKGIWHIKNFYLKDVHCHDRCKYFWEDVIRMKEKRLSELKEMIGSHLHTLTHIA